MATKKESFTKQFEELEALTEKFERGDFDLDEGLKDFEQGLKLAAELKKRLTDVEQKVEVIKRKFADNTNGRMTEDNAESDAQTENVSSTQGNNALPF